MKKAGGSICLLILTLMLAAGPAFAGPVLDRILQKKELAVAVTGDQPPLNVKDKKGEIIGFEADMAKMIAAAMGVKVRFATMPFADLLPALEAGKVDMVLSGMTITPQRNLKVDFVGPYYVSGKGILARAEKIGSMKEISELDKPDFSVAALKGSTSQEFVEKVIPKAKHVFVKTYDDAIDMLLAGKVDAFIGDYPYCAVSGFRYKDKGLVVGKNPFTFEPLGIALPPNDSHFVNWVGNFLRLLDGSGELQRLNDRWFKNASWVKELPE
jgi:polar amino acid transport system substrate-binding protein